MNELLEVMKKYQKPTQYSDGRQMFFEIGLIWDSGYIDIVTTAKYDQDDFKKNCQVQERVYPSKTNHIELGKLIESHMISLANRINKY